MSYSPAGDAVSATVVAVGAVSSTVSVSLFTNPEYKMVRMGFSSP